jgi:hypothetical protein
LDDDVNPFHGFLEPGAIADVADEKAHRVLVAAERLNVLHLELLEFVTAVDHAAPWHVALKDSAREPLAEGTRTARDEDTLAVQ